MEKQKQRGYGFWRRGMAAVLAIGAVLLGPQCMAQVLTTVEEAGPADCVYIAGNPNLYPIEYYDSEQQCYRGILPELLGMVAEDTGISFAYVNAGSEDSRLEMARNSQVEMVTAFRWGEFSRMVLPVQRTVLTTETDGRETAICVGFTGIIKEELPGAHHKGAGGHPGGGQNYLGNLLYHGAGAAGRVEEGTLGRGGGFGSGGSYIANTRYNTAWEEKKEARERNARPADRAGQCTLLCGPI